MSTLSERYFAWLCGKVSPIRDYKQLLKCLDAIEFTYTIDMDGNREADGTDLRYQFAYEANIPDREIVKYLDIRQCSVLEMMIALAQKMENIMEDPDIGEQMPDWFWTMIRNLGLDVMNDKYFDEHYVKDKVEIFLNREYEPNGRGGLFVLKDRRDLRGVELWVQAMWYLDDLLSERR